MIDINSLTMGEIGTIEKLSGQSITALGDEGAFRGLTLAAVAMVFKRRNGHPSFTWNDAQNLTFADVSELLQLAASDTNDETADDDEALPEAA